MNCECGGIKLICFLTRPQSSGNSPERSSKIPDLIHNIFGRTSPDRTRWQHVTLRVRSLTQITWPETTGNIELEYRNKEYIYFIRSSDRYYTTLPLALYQDIHISTIIQLLKGLHYKVDGRHEIKTWSHYYTG